MWDVPPSLWLELRIWGSPWISHLDGLKPNSHGQSTNILASEKPSFLVTCIILSHTVPHAPAMEGVRNVGSPGKARKTLPCAYLVENVLGPCSQEHHNDQHLALKFWLSPAVWGGALERAVEVDRTSQLFILSRSLTPWSSCQKCEETTVQSNPFQCPHHSHRLELKNKRSTKPQILGFLAWLGNIYR